MAAENPDAIITEPVDPVLGLMPFQCRRAATRLGLSGAALREAASVLASLYRIFIEHDCSLVEVNPLIVTGDGSIMALDAKMDVEDDALFRHADLQQLRDRNQEDPLEAEAADDDIAYVSLDRVCGLPGQRGRSGHGHAGRRQRRRRGARQLPDVGGGATEEKVAKAVSIILSDPKVDRVLVNVFGGILRCDVPPAA